MSTTKTKEEIQQFIIDTLLPYKEDVSTCAFNENEGLCEYLTRDGKMCAVGKHLKHNSDVQGAAMEVDELVDNFGEDIFTEDALSYGFSVSDWRSMQKYHDYMALKSEGRLSLSECISHIVKLETKYKIDLSVLKLDKSWNQKTQLHAQ